jgi:hypothetical protein
MKKLLVSLVVLTPVTLTSLEILKKVVPTGISASKSQSLLQHLKQEIQRKAPRQTIQNTLQAYKHSLQPTHKKFWESRSSVPTLPHVTTPKQRAIASLDNALKNNDSYEMLEGLLQTLERSR